MMWYLSQKLVTVLAWKYIYWDTMVWSCMFAVNAQNISVQHVNWNLSVGTISRPIILPFFCDKASNVNKMSNVTPHFKRHFDKLGLINTWPKVVCIFLYSWISVVLKWPRYYKSVYVSKCICIVQKIQVTMCIYRHERFILKFALNLHISAMCTVCRGAHRNWCVCVCVCAFVCTLYNSVVLNLVKMLWTEWTLTV